MRHYACGLLQREGCILLGKRAPHRKACPNRWDMIGGQVEDRETVDDALRRELREEIGVVPVSYESLGCIVETGLQERGEATHHLHLIRSWAGGEPIIQDDEHTALAWFTIEQACALPDLAMVEYIAIFRRIGA